MQVTEGHASALRRRNHWSHSRRPMLHQQLWSVVAQLPQWSSCRPPSYTQMNESPQHTPWKLAWSCLTPASPSKLHMVTGPPNPSQKCRPSQTSAHLLMFQWLNNMYVYFLYVLILLCKVELTVWSIAEWLSHTCDGSERLKILNFKTFIV